MKALIFLLSLMFCVSSFAAETIEAELPDSQFQILDLFFVVKKTYSQTSELNAKVIELLGGDGMNPTRMVLVLSTGYHDTKMFTLGEMMYEVTRIVFLAKDVVVINYTQDSFDENDNQIQLKKSVTIKVLRNADNTLADKIEIL